jgi:hypothetical protein
MSLGCEVVKRMRSSPSISSSARISRASDQSPPPARPVIGVHVLAQQRDLAHAALHQIARLARTRHRAADLGAAGIGHDAEGAELVAALLHGQERRRAAPRLGRAFGRWSNLSSAREIGVERLLPRRAPSPPARQAVIALRADHEIDQRLAAHDLLALGLRHAARHADLEVGLRGLQPLNRPSSE